MAIAVLVTVVIPIFLWRLPHEAATCFSPIPLPEFYFIFLLLPRYGPNVRALPKCIH